MSDVRFCFCFSFRLLFRLYLILEVVEQLSLLRLQNLKKKSLPSILISKTRNLSGSVSLFLSLDFGQPMSERVISKQPVAYPKHLPASFSNLSRSVSYSNRSSTVRLIMLESCLLTFSVETLMTRIEMVLICGLGSLLR